MYKKKKKVNKKYKRIRRLRINHLKADHFFIHPIVFMCTPIDVKRLNWPFVAATSCYSWRPVAIAPLLCLYLNPWMNLKKSFRLYNLEIIF